MRHKPRLSPSALFLLLALVVPSILVGYAARPGAAAPGEKVSPAADTAARVRRNYGQLPLSFEPNRGQADAPVQFLARNGSYSLYLKADEMTLALRAPARPEGAKGETRPVETRASVLRIKLLGASGEPRAAGSEELAGKSNYLVGRDPSKWRTNVPNYARVKFEGVYPGVDVVYYGTRRQLEYDFHLAPGADARVVRLSVEGAHEVRVEENGDLVLPTPAGEVRQHAPYAYQDVEGVRRTVDCRYVKLSADRVGFELGEYDRSKPLVIDPILTYSTFLGGGDYDEANSVAVDALGHAYVTGAASSWNFPVTSGASQAQRSGAPHQFNYDAFVTKLNHDGTALVYSTFLGGAGGDEYGRSIALDAAGNAYVGGSTDSQNFPVTAGAYRTAPAGETDMFVAKLNASGTALVYSTYLGGGGSDYIAQIGLGGDNSVYVGGRTHSGDFPRTPDAFQTVPRGLGSNLSEGFVTRLNPSGTALVFSTFLGGTDDDMVEGLAVAKGLDDSVYVTGRTSSADFPTSNAWQREHAQGGSAYDTFVTRLNSEGNYAIYSTYLGGAGDELSRAVAVDAEGAAYVGGLTHSESLPTTPTALQPYYTPSGTSEHTADAFLAKFSPDGRSLRYLTYFGGAGNDDVLGLAVDFEGTAHVAGMTSSRDLPVTANAFQNFYGGGSYDGFYLMLHETGAPPTYATYVGREEWDAARGVAVDNTGGVYLAGTTFSQYFPVTAGVFQPEPGDSGKSDGFVMKFDFGMLDYRVTGRVTNQFGNGLGDVTVSVAGDYEASVTTDAGGYYTLAGLPPGSSVTVRAERHGFEFPQGPVTFDDLDGDKTADFSGPAPLVIEGRLRDDDGLGVYAPVTITSDDGSVDYTTETFFDGRYRFVVPSGVTYTLTPGPSDYYAFTPPSKVFDDVEADQSFDFLAQFPPSIVGRIAAYGHPFGLPNVRVTLTSPALAEPVVETTDAYGYFYFNNLVRGATYTVTPSDPETNRTFDPGSHVVGNIQSPKFLDFTALPPLAIHGRVADANDRPVAATILLAGAVEAQAEVDQWGYFSFLNLPRGGDYTVTVTKPGSLYTFAPPTRAVTNLQEMQILSFEALPPLNILGHVADANDKGLGGVTVTLSGDVSATTKTDPYGGYYFEGLPRGGNYTVTPSLPLYTFAPPSRGVADIQSDQILIFEALPPLEIVGGVSGEDGLGVAGVAVTLSGPVTRTAVTDQWGGFNFRDLPRGGDYVVTPAHDLYDFTPRSRAFPAMSADAVAAFDGALRRFTLSGRVSGPGGAPLPGVNVQLGGAAEALRQTDQNGNYAFDNLVVGRDYAVTASRPGYSFAPAAHSVNDPRGDRSANFDGARLNYTISGRVTDKADGAALAGATVTLGGGSEGRAQTDAEGRYSFAGLPSEGDYTVHVSHPHYGFGFPSLTHHNLLSDMPADFAGTRLKRQLRGRVTDGSGAALAGVNVTLGGAGSAATQTDSFGDYLFQDLPSGSDYTVTVAKTHYTFSPASRRFEDLGGDATADFTATLLRHRISGRVVDANGNGFAGAFVNLIGVGAVTTDATGDFSFDNLPAGGNYTVDPSRQFYSFSPARASWLDMGADQHVTFTATLNTYSLGGRVTEGANGVSGVTVNLGGTRTAAALTDANGNYLFTALPADGTYTVTPAATAVYAFSPAAASFNTLRFNETANFAAARRLYAVGGAARDACGRALAGVTMSLTRDGVTVNAQTDSSGLYAFANVPAGYNYTLAPTGTAYTFTPPSYALPGLSASQTADFTGRPPTAAADVFALADLYVRGGSSAGTYFGKATSLVVRLASQGKDTYESYLRFNVGQPCTVGSVKLRLYGQLSASGNLPVGVYGVPSTTWSETATNWNNKPAAGALLRTVSVPGTTAAWYEWDVTDYVRAELAAGRTNVAFALKSTTTTSHQVSFTAREATGTNAPRLVVTTP